MYTCDVRHKYTEGNEDNVKQTHWEFLCLDFCVSIVNCASKAIAVLFHY